MEALPSNSCIVFNDGTKMYAFGGGVGVGRGRDGALRFFSGWDNELYLTATGEWGDEDGNPLPLDPAKLREMADYLESIAREMRELAVKG